MDAPPPQVEVRGACDLRCGWCNVQGTPPTNADDELARVGSLLEGLAAAGHVSVGLGLLHSEPTTHPDLPEIIARARSLGFISIHLATSGVVLSDRAALRALRREGLTGVSLTLVGGDSPVTDALLGRQGAGRMKLRAVDNALAEGLVTSVSLGLVRPTLGELPEVAAEVARAIEASGGAGAVHGTLLDPVPGMSDDRVEVLWPRYDEILWATERLRAAVPGLPMHALYLPSCVAGAVELVVRSVAGPGTSAVDAQREPAMCRDCDEGTCAGVESHQLRLHLGGGLPLPLEPAAPPEWTVVELEELLHPARPAHGADMAGAASLLSRLAASGRPLRGYVLSDLAATDEGARLRLVGPAGQIIEVRVEPTERAQRFFAAGERFAVSHEGGAPEPDDVGQSALRALLELLERAVPARCDG